MVFKVKDHYYKLAKKENFLARSVYKLEEIQKKYKILQAGDRVIDFGYYPGSWIQYTAPLIGPKGSVTGIDIQEIHSQLKELKNVRTYCKDIFQLESLKDVDAAEAFDVVLSDMAPNTSGITSVDQDRSLNLVERVFALLPGFLRSGGHLTIKVFESHSAQKFLKDQKRFFNEFHYLRPKSTRSVSKEFFVIGKSFRP